MPVMLRSFDSSLVACLLAACTVAGTEAAVQLSPQEVEESRAAKAALLKRTAPHDCPDETFVPAPPHQPSGASAADGGNGGIGRVVIGVQVNVDANGNNILGDAANEPSINVDPTDPRRIVIGWRQFDTISSNFRQAGYAFSRDSGRTWTAGKLTPGIFRSDPVIGADSVGNFYYNSLRSNFQADVFKSTSGGQTWGSPVPSFGGDKNWMVVDDSGSSGAGHVYCDWRSDNFNCCGENIFSRSINGGASFQSPVAPPDPLLFGTMAVGATGTVYITGTSADLLNTFVVARSTNAKNPGVTPSFDLSRLVPFGADVVFGQAPNPGGLLGQVYVTVNRSSGSLAGQVYLLASAGPVGADPIDVRFSRSTDGGNTWSSAIRLNDDPLVSNTWQWFGMMAVAPNGRIDAVWNDTRNSPADARISQLFYSFSTNGGASWAPNVALTPQFNTHVGWPNQNKIGDYYDMVSDDVGVNVAYSATFNNEQDVYFLRIGDYDCNNNGIGDATDISGGASEDCNGNGIPDECEYLDGPLACDVNCDGSINSFDIQPFVDALSDGQPPSCSSCAGDTNADGSFNSFDIQGLVDCLG